MSDLYRDFIDQKADQIINNLGGTITPAVPNELYRDFLDRKFDDVINAVDNVKIKSFTYRGNGQYTRDIEFPVTPTIILSISSPYDGAGSLDVCDPMFYGRNLYTRSSVPVSSIGTAITRYFYNCSYNGNTITLQGSGNSGASCFNRNNVLYTVYYI